MFFSIFFTNVVQQGFFKDFALMCFKVFDEINFVTFLLYSLIWKKICEMLHYELNFVKKLPKCSIGVSFFKLLNMQFFRTAKLHEFSL